MARRSKDFCPICGAGFYNWHDHRCHPRTLAAIDRAMRTDRIDGDSRPRSKADRLALGFGMLADSGDDIEDRQCRD